MTNPSIVIFGAGGQVGRALVTQRVENTTALTRADVDLSKPEQAGEAIRRLRPDFVINAAAYTAVDKAETETELATLINADAPAQMAHACEDTGACLIHYSTDYVFDGQADKPYREQDPVGPLGVYGKTKLAGELAVLDKLERHVILRTAWVYDHSGSNFVNTMLRLGGDPDRSELSVVADQRGSPTFADDLARATHDIVDQLHLSTREGVADEPSGSRWGVFHATGSGETTWHGFAQKIFELSKTDIQLKAITTADFPTPAPRPAYSVLDNDRLYQVYGIRMPSWQDALERCLHQRAAAVETTATQMS